VEIDEVDPRDGRAFDEWYAVVDAVAVAERPGEPGWLIGELRERAAAGRPADDGTPPEDERIDTLLVRDGTGRAVGAAMLELPLRDNQHFCAVDVHVLPDARRRGAGTALLAEVTVRARAARRTTMAMDIDEPPSAEGRSAGRAFATRHGFTCATTEVRRDLALPVDPAHLDAVEADCLDRARGYRVRTWQDRCPDDLVDDRAVLSTRMSTDAPLGELDWQIETWDAARVRRSEALVARQGRTFLAAGAVDEESGRLVAFTELGVPLTRPERVYQWSTLVLSEHRGHRLGTLVKTAVLRLVAERVPQARLVSTWNAAVNAPMIAVNERLGFRTNGSLSSWQRAL
jgi:GNAT superfamily N-acetyltransferase